jgi:predicted nuclease of predicted toxin-antitoxin system
MRLLADENFPQSLVVGLRAGGHDVLWALTDCRGWKDVLLLDLAEFEARIVVTLDKDFWQIAVQRRAALKRSGVVLFRVHPATPANFQPLVRAFVEANRTWTGYISIIAGTGFRCWLVERVERRAISFCGSSRVTWGGGPGFNDDVLSGQAQHCVAVTFFWWSRIQGPDQFSTSTFRF